jgi:DtxR family Mn-dependent transcriptional regulator
MLKRLAESGYVEHVPYHGVTLTRVGHRAALHVIRRHRVLETYLATKLGYDWDSVHQEAERLEHAASEELIERMVMALGNPQYHPHGAPIPTKDGTLETPECVPLTDIGVGELVELRMVSDKNPERLRYLSSLELKPGRSFEVLGRQAFRGPIKIRLVGSSKREHIIGYELARSLFCDVLGGAAG